jgi:hypothetical protein
VPQRHERQNADGANEDDSGFQKTTAHVAEDDAGILPLDDRIQRDPVPMTAMARMTSRKPPRSTKGSASAPTT